MRNKLQYAYSIAVFIGVLITAYSMMGRNDSRRLPFQMVQTSGSKVEASLIDPAVTSLFDMESALKSLPEQDGAKRAPTQTKQNRINQKPAPKINPLPPSP